MNLKPFLARYASISITKIALLFNRAILLILCFHWLNTPQYALLTIVISLVEILRVVGDVGIEALLYSKIKSVRQKISSTLKQLIGFRLIVSIALTSLTVIIWILNDVPNYLVPILLIPLLSTVQNTAFYLLQKHKRYKDILMVNLTTLSLCTFSILFAYLIKAEGLALSFFILSGELISTLMVIGFTKKELFVLLKPRLKSNTVRLISRLRNFILPSFLVGILVMFYSRLDITLVLPLLGQLKQAEFSYAFRFLEPLFLMLSIGSFALLAELGNTNRKNTVAYYGALVKAVHIHNVPFLLFASAILGASLTFIIKSVLLVNIQLLLALMLSSLIFIRLINSIQSVFLQRLGRFDLVCIAAMITFFTTFSIGYFAATRLELIGVGISILVAEIFNMLYQNHQLKRIIGNERSAS